MPGDLDLSLLPLALLVWPVARSVVYVGAAAVSLWSRKPARREAARWLLRTLHRNSDEESQ